MTKEELRKEATFTVEWESTTMIDRPLFVHGYITGAEPREKRIAELEKENAELKADNDARKFAMAMSEKVEKQLREENAELKGEAASVLDNWCRGDAPCPHLKKRDEQLTKAKELLKRWQQAYICDATVLFSQTEDFLKEE